MPFQNYQLSNLIVDGLGCCNNKTILDANFTNEAIENTVQSLYSNANILKLPNNRKITNDSTIKLPFKDNYFDCLYSIESLTQANSQHIINEFCRILKPMGKLIIIDNENKFSPPPHNTMNRSSIHLTLLNNGIECQKTPLQNSENLKTKCWFGFKRPNKKVQQNGYYDRIYNHSNFYKLPALSIPFYNSLWLKSALLAQQVNPKTIIELGCGPGHFSTILQDYPPTQLNQFYGFNFSAVAIEQATANINHHKFSFFKKNLKTYDINEHIDDNTLIVSYEFFEHIDFDLTILKNLPKGTLILFSVPSFDDPGHVKYFQSIDHVKFFYKDLLNFLLVLELPNQSERFFLALARRF